MAARNLAESDMCAATADARRGCTHPCPALDSAHALGDDHVPGGAGSRREISVSIKRRPQLR
ncbi:MAG: hypothetical protein JWN95_1769 [Frankiales bacterium]|nr:hypothetical protein [Frankiales bacterium]